MATSLVNSHVHKLLGLFIGIAILCLSLAASSSFSCSATSATTPTSLASGGIMPLTFGSENDIIAFSSAAELVKSVKTSATLDTYDEVYTVTGETSAYEITMQFAYCIPGGDQKIKVNNSEADNFVDLVFIRENDYSVAYRFPRFDNVVEYKYNFAYCSSISKFNGDDNETYEVFSDIYGLVHISKTYMVDVASDEFSDANTIQSLFTMNYWDIIVLGDTVNLMLCDGATAVEPNGTSVCLTNLPAIQLEESRKTIQIFTDRVGNSWKIYFTAPDKMAMSIIKPAEKIYCGNYDASSIDADVEMLHFLFTMHYINIEVINDNAIEFRTAPNIFYRIDFAPAMVADEATTIVQWFRSADGTAYAVNLNNEGFLYLTEA